VEAKFGVIGFSNGSTFIKNKGYAIVRLIGKLPCCILSSNPFLFPLFFTVFFAASVFSNPLLSIHHQPSIHLFSSLSLSDFFFPSLCYSCYCCCCFCYRWFCCSCSDIPKPDAKTRRMHILKKNRINSEINDLCFNILSQELSTSAFSQIMSAPPSLLSRCHFDNHTLRETLLLSSSSLHVLHYPSSSPSFFSYTHT